MLVYRDKTGFKAKKKNIPKIESPNTCINSKNYRKNYFRSWLKFFDWSVTCTQIMQSE